MGEVLPELTAELIVDGAVPQHPVISPDGRWVAYVVSTTGLRERPIGALWVAAADGSSPPRELTVGLLRDCVPRWAPDSAALFLPVGRAAAPDPGRWRRGRGADRLARGDLRLLAARRRHDGGRGRRRRAEPGR